MRTSQAMKSRAMKFWAITILSAWNVYGIDEHIENKQWDPARPPIVDEPQLDQKEADKLWKKVAKEKSAVCDSKRSWHAQPSSRLEATAVKEHNVDVRGGFTRFRICVLPKPEEGKAQGEGWIDLSSWDSGLAARDRRVSRYVFGTEKAGQALVHFTFQVDPWKLPTVKENPNTPRPDDTWTATLNAEIQFRGMPIKASWPVTLVVKDGHPLQMTATNTSQLSFMQDSFLASFTEMMKLCNHHFLASFAKISFDLKLDKKH